MRFGPDRMYERESALCSWTEDCGTGIMGIEGSADLPDECYEFIRTQFARFGVPLPEPLDTEIPEALAYQTMFYLDYHSPYVPLIELSDVEFTNEWCSYTYEILDPEGKQAPVEADPEKLETFRFVPGQCERWFEYFMSHPGLKALPGRIGQELTDMLSGDYYGDRGVATEQLTERGHAMLVEICTSVDPNTQKEVFNQDMWDTYTELAGWATFVWFMGPPGREYRYAMHDVFHWCLEKGECVIYDRTTLGPDQYRQVQRMPQSCAKCSLDSWCVELTLIEGTARYLCEVCLNGRAPMFSQANCGSRMCKYIACPYHPAQGDGKQGLYDVMRGGGQIAIGNQNQPQPARIALSS